MNENTLVDAIIYTADDVLESKCFVDMIKIGPISFDEAKELINIFMHLDPPHIAILPHIEPAYRSEDDKKVL